MKYRKLGRSGLDVSLICLGTMTWGQQNTEAEGHEQMDYALDQGVNFWDTAELYSIPPNPQTAGSTERIIGSWFASRGKRGKVILASKVVGRTDMDWFRNGKAPGRLSRAHIHEAVDGSLKRLQTDYIDLYQLHWPDRPMTWGSNPTVFHYQRADDEISIGETLSALDDLVKAGKIRAVGLSNESAWGTMTFLKEAEMHGLARIASVQNAYNLINRTNETALAEIFMREEVGLLAYSPLAQGFLTGKYLDGARPPGARTTLFDRGQRYQKPGAEEAIRAYIALAREFGLDPAQMALAFVNTRPFLGANIIGATSMAQLKTNIASINVEISPELEARIDAVHQVHMNPAP
ncbi:MAG: aldo/keto reductase [Methylocystis sp.]|nr:aldo/keto reductase [Methylocystis sp.]MCA3584951.1 aldo/keto reductase [Methylocystis sp.]MCA3589847.1 aldo/keto reductase [Methylocystis sp.]MCA3593490.1 aldo/keto reductase [Methylocystis sp.]